MNNLIYPVINEMYDGSEDYWKRKYDEQAMSEEVGMLENKNIAPELLELMLAEEEQILWDEFTLWDKF